MQPHRGILVLILGILSLVGCSFFTGIPAWIMGKGDLRQIDAGQMQPDGRTLTQIGMILGIISVVMAVLGIIIWGVMLLILGVGAAAGSGLPQ